MMSACQQFYVDFGMSPSTSLHMRCIMRPVHKGFPKTTRNNYDPELSIHYTTFVGL